MTRKTRRLTFYIFLFLFIILALGIILYAQGYTFNLQKKSLVITGAFYLKSHPKEADIYINNEYKGKTNKFIKRLTSGEYNIKISKSNYYDWQKTLEITSKLVTEAKNILLIKKNPILNLTTHNPINYLSFSPDNKEIAYLTDKTISSTPILCLIDLDENIDEQIYPLPSLNLKNLLKISWSNDKEKLLLHFPNNNYYILDLKNQSKIINLNNLIYSLSNYKIYDVENLLFHPQNSNKIYFSFKNNLYFIELDKSDFYKSLISPPIISDILTYAIYNNNILYIKRLSGNLYKTSFETSSFKKIFEIPLLMPEQTAKIINDEIFMIDNILYLFKPQTQVLEKIAGEVQEIHFSDNEEKLLWRTEDEIGVVWLTSESEQPLKKQYETEIIIRMPGKISQTVWYSKTNQHIIFVEENEIKIVELDNRKQRNITNILPQDNLNFSIEKPKILYSKWNEKLYILSKKQLFEIDMSY